MHTLRLAWRNIGRNGRRTAITAAALGVGVALVVFVWALMTGMFGRIVLVATGSLTGHAQIHAGDWRTTRDERTTLPHTADLLARARALPGVVAATPRVYTTGLLAVGDRAQGVQVLGIQPESERDVTNWGRRLVAGRLVAGPGEVVIGAELARVLDVEVDTRLVLTVADVETGAGEPERVELVGVLATGDPGLDKQTAIVSMALAQRLLGVAEAHEIALLVDRPPGDQAAIEAVIAPLAAPGLAVEPWQAINRMVAQALALQGVFLGIFVAIIFFLLAFGIVNTVAMSLAERTREFGVLRALGTPPGRLAGLILAEAGWLGAVGAVPGALIGAALTAWLGAVGLDLGATSAYGVRFTEPLYPHLSVAVTAGVAALFVALTMLTAGLAAWRVTRIRPVDALRR